MTTKKSVLEQNKWNVVADELSDEKLKLASYDNILISIIGDIQGKNVLDYGCGPGILASVLKKFEAEVKGFDISEEMRTLCAQSIGNLNVYNEIGEIPAESFDFVVCNLVMCIVDDDEVKRIADNIRKALRKGGKAFVGFCNPKIKNVPESQLDFREQTSFDYYENHTYMKTKKEGNYEILEIHRPLEWYTKVFSSAGLKVEGTIYTPEYELNGRKIQDFVIFQLKKGVLK